MNLDIASIRARDPARFATLNRGDVPAKRKGRQGGTAAMRKTPRKRVLVCRARIDTTKTFATILIPGLKLQSEANNREHWRPKAIRVKKQKLFVGMHLSGSVFPPLPVLCRIVRIGCRTLDVDNKWGSAKHLIDAIAAHYGIDDRDSRIEWDVTQEKGKEYAVRIELAAIKGDS